MPSSATFQVGWGLSLRRCSCFGAVLEHGADPSGAVWWEPLWRSQLGWANWVDLFLRGTPGVSKVDREWPKSHWPILGQLGGRSLVKKKKKMVPANTFMPRECSTRSWPSSTQSELSNDSASFMTHSFQAAACRLGLWRRDFVLEPFKSGVRVSHRFFWM